MVADAGACGGGGGGAMVNGVRPRQRRGTRSASAAPEEAGAGAAPKDKERLLQGGRVLRSRRYRRPFDDHRHTKRLFTPEIKRFLKGWLVRRRDNPYPNRDEKKGLAVQTGLTYIQICNWFANWRRKLKNAGSEARQRTWGNLIKSYNTQAHGNVEQFSICSDDSIWEEEEDEAPDADQSTSKREDMSSCPSTATFTADAATMDHSYSVLYRKDNLVPAGSTTISDLPQCSQISSTTEELVVETPFIKTPSASSSKYKSHMMEKYLRDIGTDEGTSTGSDTQEDETSRKVKKAKKEDCPPLLLSKWLESAAKYQPGQSYIAWSAKNVTWKSPSSTHDSKRSHHWNISVGVETQSTENSGMWPSSGHLREELDAAVALTRLSGLQH
ncbi:hypothetical protein R5R35_005077 [Gryllus longicercus]|uniref:Homeobox domain-containing protein n=1 Tax=Gryllus longicercus TaxID=2509291 RepID=A0AAN9VMP4_9ORTH